MDGDMHSDLERDLDLDQEVEHAYYGDFYDLIELR